MKSPLHSLAIGLSLFCAVGAVGAEAEAAQIITALIATHSRPGIGT